MSSRIYFDHSATTPLDPRVFEAMEPFLRGAFGNPSSRHHEGRIVRSAVETARAQVAELIGARPEEIVFTASGTEADNLALIGAVRASGQPGHVVTSSIEHAAVLETCRFLAASGTKVTHLPVDGDGVVALADLLRALESSATIVSIMAANNVVGTLEPIEELAYFSRLHGVLFHTDAVQAGGKIPLDVNRLHVDLLSLSAHKFYGPKGVGVLYAREGVVLEPLIHGGGQEFGRRSGTENVAGVVGFAAALERAVAEQPERAARIGALRDRLEAGLRDCVDDMRVNGSGAPRLPNNSNLSFAGVDSETMLMRMDLEGIAVSAGSACTSGALEPSHVIAGLNIDPRWRQGVIRFSLGETTTEEEIDRVLELVPRIAAELRGRALL